MEESQGGHSQDQRVLRWETLSVELELIARARSGDEDAFRALVDRHRGELLAHCYRMLGSMHDAEDAIQETLLSAWKGLAGFEGRSSLRTWLFRIATNRCLNMLRSDSRGPTRRDELEEVQLPEPTRLGQILWLEPYPDDLFENVPDAAPGPEARYEAHEAISLAFVTALQTLPPRQRAVLILREVLGYRAQEVAAILDSTEESVTSALKRARATLQGGSTLASARGAPAASSSAEREVVERFVSAFESGDLDGVVAVLTEDVWFTMPPLPLEFQGRSKARQFLAAVTPPPVVARRLVLTRANGQPALGMYFGDRHAPVLHLVGLLVLTLNGDQVSAITRFDHTALERFKLPRTLAAAE